MFAMGLLLYVTLGCSFAFSHLVFYFGKSVLKLKKVMF